MLSYKNCVLAEPDGQGLRGGDGAEERQGGLDPPGPHQTYQIHQTHLTHQANLTHQTHKAHLPQLNHLTHHVHQTHQAHKTHQIHLIHQTQLPHQTPLSQTFIILHTINSFFLVCEQKIQEAVTEIFIFKTLCLVTVRINLIVS
jgi:hypothetical protein